MRIISKFKDYYDSCNAFGFDPQSVWVRETQSAPLSHSPLNSIPIVRFYGFACKTPKGSRHYAILARLIVFCGKLYPCLELIETDPSQSPIGVERTFFYSLEDFEAKMQSLGKSLDELLYRHYLDDWSSRGSARLKRWFESMTGFNSLAMKWSVETKTVSAVFPVRNPNSELAQDALIQINPTLKDYQFYKLFSSPNAFQEVSMFYGGVLPSSISMPIQISDKDRIAQHGFDKHSFRKQKGA